MSSVEIESPSIARRLPRRLASSEVTVGFPPAQQGSLLRRRSRPGIVDIDDDNAGRSVSVRRAPSPITIDGDERPTNRRRVGNGSQDDRIFVDDDADDVGSSSRRRTSNGAQNRPIIILDSDEEQSQPSGSSSRLRAAGNGIRRRRARASPSFRIFSPSPPPPQHYPVPPVPPLPPVIAGPMPFAILPPPPNPNPTRNHIRLGSDQNPQPAAPALPSERSGIHLGGGLLSQGNATGRRRNAPAQVHNPFAVDHATVARRYPLGMAALGRLMRSYAPTGLFHSANTHEANDNADANTNANPSGGRRISRLPRVSTAGTRSGQFISLRSLLDLGDSDPDPIQVQPQQQQQPGAGFFGFEVGPWARRDAALGLGPDYDKSMTHPGRAGPGWTFDLGAENDMQDGEEGKADAGAEILVCAQCLDPLISNAEGMVDVGEHERKERRVWGLRCGHVLDGKCVGALMNPEASAAHDHRKGKEGKGKGKQKAVELDEEEEIEVDVLVKPLDFKGKVPARAPTPPLSTDMEEILTPAPAPIEDNSIRSRLRPRRAALLTPFAAAAEPFIPSPRRSTRGATSLKKRKRVAEVEAEAVEDRYEWACPVAGCGMAHTSVKVAGVWRADTERGAVAMFV